MSLARVIRGAADAFGLKLERNSLYTRQDWRLQRFLEHHRIATVIDVGANRGQFASEVLKGGFKGRVISFEALPDVHRLLAEEASRWGGRWTVAPRCALSNEAGTARFHVADNLASSSLLPPLDVLGRSGVHFDQHAAVEVPCARLDEVLVGDLTCEAPIFLKLDVQGAEAKVLQGATRVLHQVVGLLLEMSTAPLYEGQATSRDMDAWLLDQGFELWDIEPGFRSPDLGRLYQFDGIYFRARS